MFGTHFLTATRYLLLGSCLFSCQLQPTYALVSLRGEDSLVSNSVTVRYGTQLENGVLKSNAIEGGAVRDAATGMLSWTFTIVGADRETDLRFELEDISGITLARGFSRISFLSKPSAPHRIHMQAVCEDAQSKALVCAMFEGSGVCNDAGECVESRCGDGVWDARREQCDDGNQIQTDACLNTCRKATCGDGHICSDPNCMDTADGMESCDTADKSCHNCSCASGYENSETAIGCTDIDECADADCGPGGDCSHEVGETTLDKYTCTSCSSGYEALNDGVNTPCTDINECAEANCGLGGVCIHAAGETTPDKYTCTVCSPGFEALNDGVNTACTDIDECIEIDCGGLGGTCLEEEGEPTAGNYTCDCVEGSGYVGGGLKTDCNCTSGYHEGGDGTCVRNEECSDGFVLASSGVCTSTYSVVYVKHDAAAAGNNSGTSWEHAHRGAFGLKAALDGLAASLPAPVEIWIAEGTYKPVACAIAGSCTTDERQASFLLANDVALYGGFSGSENARNARDPEANITVLSGDIGIEGDVTDNSYHVVSSTGLNASAKLDGLTITQGNADGDDAESKSGGGMRNEGGSPTLRNINIVDNRADARGGGLNLSAGSSPVLSYVRLVGNSANAGGGVGILSTSELGSNPVLRHVIFAGNTAISLGGGLYCTRDNFTYISPEVSTPKLKDVIFSGNTADTGGGMSSSLHVALARVVFAGNLAEEGGGSGDGWGTTIQATNVAFVGNIAEDAAGGVLRPPFINALKSFLSLTQSTFAGNRAMSSRGGGIGSVCDNAPSQQSCFPGFGPMIRNSLFWDNRAAEPGFDNVSGFVHDMAYTALQGGYAGANVCTADCAVTALTETPFIDYPTDATGTWKSAASYSSASLKTTLTDTSMAWEVDSLAGQYVKPAFDADDRMFFIASNTATTIQVWGDLSRLGTCSLLDFKISKEACDGGDWTPLLKPDTPYDSYAIYNLALKDASEGVDAGNNGAVLSLDADGDGVANGTGVCLEVDTLCLYEDPEATTDLAGNSRFLNDTGVSDTGTPASSTLPVVDLGAYEKQTDGPD
jgi:cysteine-rich repeat protein